MNWWFFVNLVVSYYKFATENEEKIYVLPIEGKTFLLEGWWNWFVAYTRRKSGCFVSFSVAGRREDWRWRSIFYSQVICKGKGCDEIIYNDNSENMTSIVVVKPLKISVARRCFWWVHLARWSSLWCPNDWMLDWLVGWITFSEQA